MELFLVFPFGSWGIDGRWRGRGTVFFAFMFASTFALSLFALTSTFVRGLTLAFIFGNVWIWRIEVPNIAERERLVAVPGVGGPSRSRTPTFPPFWPLAPLRSLDPSRPNQQHTEVSRKQINKQQTPLQ